MLKPCKNIILIIVVLIATQLQIFSQVKVQVIKQEFSKSFDWEEGQSFWVDASRAEIYCSSHTKSTIDIDLEIIVKNENKETAEADLQKMKWLHERAGKKIYIRNYIELERNESKPESDIKVIYNIKVPINCAVNIDNYFGPIKIWDLASALTINSEFSKIELEDLVGNIRINSTFGDIFAEAIEGDLDIESVRSNIEIAQLYGRIDLQSVLAEIRISEIHEITELSMKAEKSKIFFTTTDFEKYQYLFYLNKVQFTFPDHLNLQLDKNDKEIIKAKYHEGTGKPLIDIKLSIGSLIIE